MKSIFDDPKLRALGAVLLLAAASLAVFGQVGSFDFVNYDDTTYLIQNPYLRFGFTGEGIRWAFAFPGFQRGEEYSPFWRPVTYLSHMADTQFFGLSPGGHHWVSLILHFLNIALLFFILRLCTGNLPGSFLTTLLFAIHPLQAEPVAWISARNVVLSTFFALGTLGSYLSWVKHRNSGYVVLMTSCYLLGLMSKSTLVVLPALLLLLDYWPLHRKETKNGVNGWMRLTLEKWPLISLAVLSAAISIATQPTILQIPVSLMTRISRILVSFPFYIGKTLWPFSLTLFPDWDPRQLLPVQSLSSGLLLAAITFGVWHIRKTSPYLLTGWFWFVLNLLPATALPQPAARYMYVAIIGLGIMLSWGITQSLDRFPKARWASTGLMLAITAGLIPLAHAQAGYWRNGVTLYLRVLDIYPDHYLAHVNLGNAFGRLGRLDEAVLFFEKAILIEPRMPAAYENLGKALLLQGKTREAQSTYRRMLEINPGHGGAMIMLGELARRDEDFESSVFYHSEALKVMPGEWIPHMNLGLAYEGLGREEDALLHYRASLQKNQNNPEVHNRIAEILTRQGNRDEAIPHRILAAELSAQGFGSTAVRDPLQEDLGSAEDSLHQAADILYQQGRVAEAIKRYEEALGMNPKNWLIHFKTGTALARLERFEEALPHFKEAVKIKPDFADAYNNMGGAAMSLGRLEEAVSYFRKAVELSNGKPHYRANLSLALKKSRTEETDPSEEDTNL